MEKKDVVTPVFIVSSFVILFAFLLISQFNERPSNRITNTDLFESTSSSPNIVFILADDLGWNSIGYENYDLTFESPHLSKLAEEGIIMSNFYAQELCVPSRAAFLTGRYPLTIGFQYDLSDIKAAWSINFEETYLPQVLNDNGYTTYMLGKWDQGFFTPKALPTARGFDYFLGYLSSTSYYWSKRLENMNEFTDFMYSNTDCYAKYNGSGDLQAFELSL